MPGDVGQVCRPERRFADHGAGSEHRGTVARLGPSHQSAWASQQDVLVTEGSDTGKFQIGVATRIGVACSASRAVGRHE